ncbi:MAG: 2-amino-4-hydroxy-6-hydroxymethyldihydropteridine diphosphokinase [Propionibacteriaceae bacterium]|jgi:2-amino-4-hydroxy-6-hydroxymethyldihydropteridine diphosphokinase|nr:2-amino-4-hydroxy-6-hydroxymethyldihydropteridine diphosphokinase [Propionibacteriaceae bacterium]
MKAVLSLGSNIGNREDYLARARKALAQTPGVQLVKTSGIYETEPFGTFAQRDFLNQIVIADITITAEELLERALSIEADLGRVRVQDKGPRTVDIDLIQVGDVLSNTPKLTLPHPAAHERAFVLVPWLEADPQAVLPGFGPVKELVGTVNATSVRRYV